MSAAFILPDELIADEPAEARGLARDQVRMLVACASEGLAHRRFDALPSVLRAGDLLVVNTSATLPAALDGSRLVHVAGELDDGRWIVEVRDPAGGPARDVMPGEVVALPARASATIAESYPVAGIPGSRLWLADATVSRVPFLAEHGRPITYGSRRWPLADYQTIFATDPGSAEMPSAARPFTAGTLVALVARGVMIAPLTLHCSVSSPETHELPVPERFSVPPSTARLVSDTRAAGGRVIAIGTTVVRALETVAATGRLAGWTDHVVGPRTPVRWVDGLLSGLHDPTASHLLMLEAVAGPAAVQAAYDASLAAGYLWHQFGDLTLFLP